MAMLAVFVLHTSRARLYHWLGLEIGHTFQWLSPNML